MLGLNTNDLLFSYVNTTLNEGLDNSYTATKDCIVIVSFQAKDNYNTVTISIDGVSILVPIFGFAADYPGNTIQIPLKKNQTFRIVASIQDKANLWSMKVFGLK